MQNPLHDAILLFLGGIYLWYPDYEYDKKHSNALSNLRLLLVYLFILRLRNPTKARVLIGC